MPNHAPYHSPVREAIVWAVGPLLRPGILLGQLVARAGRRARARLRAWWDTTMPRDPAALTATAPDEPGLASGWLLPTLLALALLWTSWEILR